MTISGSTRLIVALLLGTAITLAGCNQLAWFGYFISPSSRYKTIDAEFEGLEDKKVAVVIVAHERLLYQYPDLREQLCAMINLELTNDEYDLDIEVVRSGRIVKYQNSNSDWQAMDRPAMAKAFGADYLLQVTLGDYSMTESGSTTLYRGYICARAEVFDAAKPAEEAMVWSGEVEASYPPDGRPVTRMANAEDTFRTHTGRLFANELVKRFRTYKMKKAKSYRVME